LVTTALTISTNSSSGVGGSRSPERRRTATLPLATSFSPTTGDVRRPALLRVADTRRQRGVAVVDLSAQVPNDKRISYPPAVSDGHGTDRHDDYLNGSQPHG
jgi:hypothetical protein